MLTIAVVLVLALAGAGCGGGDDEAAGDTDTVVTDTTTTDGTTTDETTTNDTDSTSGIFSSEDCQELIAASTQLGQAFAAAGGLEGDADEVTALFEEFAENAPEEIRDDLQVLADAYAAYATALADVDLQAGETPDAQTLAEIQQAIASLDQAEVAAASAALSTWSTENC